MGAATEELLAFPYLANWGFPERFNRKPSENSALIVGLPASRGIVEGTARVLLSPDQFDDVRQGEIAVCRMTSPAWVVLFTRIGGLVTDAGGMASHPAVISREFAIPAVVGTSDATRRIRTGDRVRVLTDRQDKWRSFEAVAGSNLHGQLRFPFRSCIPDGQFRSCASVHRFAMPRRHSQRGQRGQPRDHDAGGASGPAWIRHHLLRVRRGGRRGGPPSCLSRSRHGARSADRRDGETAGR